MYSCIILEVVFSRPNVAQQISFFLIEKLAFVCPHLDIESGHKIVIKMTFWWQNIFNSSHCLCLEQACSLLSGNMLVLVSVGFELKYSALVATQKSQNSPRGGKVLAGGNFSVFIS